MLRFHLRQASGTCQQTQLGAGRQEARPRQTTRLEFDFGHRLYVWQLLQILNQLFARFGIDLQKGKSLAARRIATDLHTRDIYTVLAQGLPEVADNPRPVIICKYKDVPFGYGLHRERIDHDYPRLPALKYKPRCIGALLAPQKSHLYEI